MIKTLRVFNQDSNWGAKNTSTLLAFNLDESKEIGTISFEKISGPDIYIEALVSIVAYDLDILSHVTKYVSDYTRKNSFYIRKREGQSGCIDLALYENYNKFSIGANAEFRNELHISCYEKVDINSIQNMWIGDLVELLLEYDREEITYLLHDVVIDNSKKGIRKQRGNLFTYVKNRLPQKKITIDLLLNEDEFYGDEDVVYTTKPGFYRYENDNEYMRPVSELDDAGIKIHKLSNFMNDNPMHKICIEYEGSFYTVEYRSNEYVLDKSNSEKLPYPWTESDSFVIDTREHREVYVYLNHEDRENYVHVRFINNKLEVSFVHISEEDSDSMIDLYSNFYYIDSEGKIKNMKKNKKFMSQVENEFNNTFNSNDLM